MPLSLPERRARVANSRLPKAARAFRWHHASREIWQSLAVQLIFELITDTVCVVAEARRGLDPVAVWRRLPKAQLLPAFLLMSAYATLAGTFRVTFGDNFYRCENKDMCCCGLRPDGVLEAYCQLLYPNTSGVPPGAGAAP